MLSRSLSNSQSLLTLNVIIEFLNMSGIINSVTRSQNHQIALNIYVIVFVSVSPSIVRKIRYVYNSSALLFEVADIKRSLTHWLTQSVNEWQCHIELSWTGGQLHTYACESISCCVGFSFQKSLKLIKIVARDVVHVNRKRTQSKHDFRLLTSIRSIEKSLFK